MAVGAADAGGAGVGAGRGAGAGVGRTGAAFRPAGAARKNDAQLRRPARQRKYVLCVCLFVFFTRGNDGKVSLESIGNYQNWQRWFHLT